jgi:hypothetical protein
MPSPSRCSSFQSSRRRSCKVVIAGFLERETALGRSDLVFSILYIRVQGLDEEARQMGDPVLAIVAKRQYLDWREHRFRDPGSLEVGQTIERFCQNICDALHRSWLSPQEQKELEEVAAQERATAERARQETEGRRCEEGARKQVEALTLARVEEEKRRRAAADYNEKPEAQGTTARRIRHELEVRPRTNGGPVKADNMVGGNVRGPAGRAIWLPVVGWLVVVVLIIIIGLLATTGR